MEFLCCIDLHCALCGLCSGSVYDKMLKLLFLHVYQIVPSAELHCNLI